MRTLIPLVLGFGLCGFVAGQDKEPKRPAPLFDNLGQHHFPITTKSEQAKKYFNQGVILVYGFNHQEAIRSFQAAAELDPDCAMAYWGIAFAHGPNINAPMPEEALPKALEAMEKAVKLAGKVSKREQAYIAAIARRYSDKPEKDRSKLDRAYADAMREVWKENPDDLDAATMFAEALMDTTPWNYWEKDGQPRAETKEVIQALEFVLAKNPNHVGANHYYIHTVEASPNPERGLACAHRLPQLCPGAGHLVHMPAHIYLKLGMYRKASEANVQAIDADESYISQCRVQGFYPLLYYSHNIHFLAYSLSMEGNQRDCLEASRKTAMHLHKHDIPDLGFVQWMRSTPAFSLLRFGRWQDILELKAPADKLLFQKAMWHFARGLAFCRLEKKKEAANEAEELERITKHKDIEELQTPDLPGVSVIEVARTLLQAELAGMNGKAKEHISLLQKAVQLEDELPYMEPPYWFLPVRQNLGSSLHKIGKHKEAEAVFRADLEKHPNNGWSLFGLLQALRAQGKSNEAAEVERRFTEAWQHADTVLTASWF
jgi:tetratricopeptide (TPR) repeat protein